MTSMTDTGVMRSASTGATLRDCLEHSTAYWVIPLAMTPARIFKDKVDFVRASTAATLMYDVPRQVTGHHLASSPL